MSKLNIWSPALEKFRDDMKVTSKLTNFTELRKNLANSKPSSTDQCMGCHRRAIKPADWIYFKFKHLASGWLCEKCRIEWQDHFVKLQVKEI